jgi:hypothetical protein
MSLSIGTHIRGCTYAFGAGEEAAARGLVSSPTGDWHSSNAPADTGWLGHARETLTLVEPGIDAPNHVLARRDPVREERLQERVAINAGRGVRDDDGRREEPLPETLGKGDFDD